MEKRKNCYIYIRVSTAAQIDGYSLDAQKERLEEYADYKELNVAGLYCDAGRSGHDIKGRPEKFQASYPPLAPARFFSTIRCLFPCILRSILSLFSILLTSKEPSNG